MIVRSGSELTKRLITTSSRLAAVARKRGTRVSRVTGTTSHTRRTPANASTPPARSSLDVHQNRHEEERTPPYPTTKIGDDTKYPWASYNEGPSSTSTSSTGIVSSDHDGGPGGEEAASVVASIPVNVPRDVDGVLDNAVGDSAKRARDLFAVPAIVVVRQLEMMNLFIGFEEANKYQLLSPEGTLLGYLMEEDAGFGSAMMRQALKTHRAFKTTVLDTQGNVILKINRPFSWINSRIYVSTPSEFEGEEDKVIGEAQQEWHLYRRRYNHFVKRGEEMQQFAATDSGFLAWDFYVRNEKGETIGSINRNFAGFGREIFTDTGQYVLRFEGVVDELANPAIESPPPPPSEALPSPAATTKKTSLQTNGKDSAAQVDNESGTTSSRALTSTTYSSVPTLVLPVPAITFDQRAVMLASAVSSLFSYSPFPLCPTCLGVEKD